MTAKIVHMPYTIKSRRWIEMLIELGYLRADRRHSAEAVQQALAAWKAAWKNGSGKFLESAGQDEPPGPDAA